MQRPLSLRSLTVSVLAALLAACPSSGNGGGAPTFSKSYGADAMDLATDVAPTPDGGYVMVGSFNGRRVGDSIVDEDLWVTRLDPYGDLVWSKVLSEDQTSVGTEEDARIYQSTVPRRGGGFFLVGTQDDLFALDESRLSPEDLAVARLDDDGNVLWTETFGFTAMPLFPFYDPDGETREEPTSAVPTADGGVLIGGFAQASLRAGGERLLVRAPWALKMSAAGSVEWATYVDEDLYHVAYYLFSGVYARETADGGAIVAIPERLTDEDGDLADVTTRLARLDASGSLVWTRLVDDFYAQDVRAFDRQGAGESFALVGRDLDFYSSNENKLFVLDGAGGELGRIDDLSGFEITYACAELTPAGESEDYLCVVGTVEPDDGPEHLRVEIYDSGLAPVAEVDLTGVSSLFDLRPFDEGMFFGFELLGSDLQDPQARTGDLINVRISPSGSILRYTQYPRSVPSLVEWNHLRGMHPAGWADGTTDYWLWTPLDRDDVSEGMRLARYALTAGQIWTRTFGPAFDRRVERGLQVEVIDDGDEDPETFAIAVLGEVAFDPFQNPPPQEEPLSAWLLRLDPDGEVVSQRVLEELALPYDGDAYGLHLPFASEPDLRRSGHYLEVAADGGLFVAGIEEGYARVVRLDASSNVVWCSRPLVGAERVPVRSIEATEDGGVVALGGDWIAKLAADGSVLWRQDFSRGGLSGACELVGGTLVLAASVLQYQTLIGLDADGAELWQVELGTDGSFAGDPVVGITATTDRSAAVVVYSALNPIASAPAGGVIPDLGWDLRLVRVDGTGAVSWSQSYGGLLEEALGDVCATPDGGLVVAGRSDSLGVDSEAWLLRLDSCGVIREGCQAERVRVEPLEASASTFNAAQPYLDTVPAPDDVPGSVFAATTAAREVSVFGEVVVARQCGGTSKDVPEVVLTVVIDQGMGRVEEDVQPGEAPALSCTSTCELRVPMGSEVRLRALPDPGFLEPTWSGGDCGAGPSTTCRVTMDDDRTVTVSFPVDEGGYMGELYDLTIDFQGEGTGSVFVSPLNGTCFDDCDFADLALPGDAFTLTATPLGGSSFGGWSGVDTTDGTTAGLTFRAADRTVVVRFD